MSQTLETLDWYKFLDRAPLAAPPAEELATLRGARVLVTGAGGSIGTALALRLATLRPSKLVLLDASESHLFALQNAFATQTPDADVVLALGGAQESALLEELFALHAPDLVFHAAAYKHVPLLEEQPLAAMANNIAATRALARAAARHGAQLVLLSTDKAVEPTSVMGATKRVSELLTLAAGGTAVRLANVLASRDSVAEVFAHALEAGRPLRVTDAAARRYLLTTDEAVNLLLAAALAQPGLYAAALERSHRIAELAEFVAQALRPASPVEIEYTAPRSGDKREERLWGAWESAQPARAGLVAIETPTTEALEETVESLLAAVRRRDAEMALAWLKRMVPEYTPSAALQAHVEARTEPLAR